MRLTVRRCGTTTKDSAMFQTGVSSHSSHRFEKSNDELQINKQRALHDDTAAAAWAFGDEALASE